jgi:fluoride exporter
MSALQIDKFDTDRAFDMQVIYIGIFGGLGCISRFFVSNFTYQVAGRSLPYGTLMVNVAGSFLLGLLMTFGLRSTLLPPELRVGLTTGFMGGFTTFSTFSYETLRLLEDGSYWQAGANIILNILLCLLFALVGVAVAKQL